MTTEKQVKTAARMYEMRDTAKRLLRDNYTPHMAKLGAILSTVAERRGIQPIKAAMEAAAQPGVSAMDVIMMMAAVVELTEPSA